MNKEKTSDITIWQIVPHDPLIFRDGRPFAPTPGARSKSLPFPFPATIAGSLRSLAGSDERGHFNKGNINHIKQIRVIGPFLITQKSNSEEQFELLLPAPADASITKIFTEKEGEDKTQGRLQRSIPLQFEGDISDLSTQTVSGNNEDDTTSYIKKPLWLVGPADSITDDKSKPHSKAPIYWKWSFLRKWLLESEYQSRIEELSTIGQQGITSEHRVHIKMDTTLHTALEGALFDTTGLEFTHVENPNTPLSSARQMGLVIGVAEIPNPNGNPAIQKINKKLTTTANAVHSLGGERRLTLWKRSTTISLPECPTSLVEQITQIKACRIMLVTPAYFEKGYLPTYLFEMCKHLNPELCAIAIQRPQVISGWDIDQTKPKPTRRLAPAGTIMYLKFNTEDRDAIKQWVHTTWLNQSISDDAQDRLDGFGLVVFGSWDGKAKNISSEITQVEEGEQTNA